MTHFSPPRRASQLSKGMLQPAALCQPLQEPSQRAPLGLAQGADQQLLGNQDVSAHRREKRVAFLGEVIAAAPRVAARRLLQHHRSEAHTSELQSLMRTSYAVFCLKKKTKNKNT